VDRRRWSRRTHRWRFALAILVFFAGDYYVVDRMLPPVFWFLTVSTLMHMASSFDERRGQPAWGLPALVGVLVVLVAFGVYTVRSGDASVTSVRSPDGRFTAVVTEGTAMIDPIWNMSVHQNAGLLSRKWTAGCVNGDDPTNAYESIAWVNNTTLEVRTESGQRIRVGIDATGRPLNRVTTHDEICP
jgi:hypothetical protein